jgi:hypothetical protein
LDKVGQILEAKIRYLGEHADEQFFDFGGPFQMSGACSTDGSPSICSSADSSNRENVPKISALLKQ